MISGRFLGRFRGQRYA